MGEGVKSWSDSGSACAFEAAGGVLGANKHAGRGEDWQELTLSQPAVSCLAGNAIK